jgi:hypothetical protein
MMKTASVFQIVSVGFFFFAANALTLAQIWTPTSAPSNSWHAVAMSADGVRIIAGGSTSCCAPGPIYLSTNSGSTWNPASAPVLAWQSVASSADGTRLVASGQPSSADPRGIYFSADSGTTWAPSSLSNVTFQSLAASADGTSLVGGYKYVTYTSRDGGISWTQSTFGGDQVASSADGTRLAIAYFYNNGFPSGGVYISADGGGNWQKTSAPVDGWTGLSSSADGTILGAARGPTAFPTCCGPIYLSRDSGGTWVPSDTPSVSWNSLACSADGRVFVASAATFSPNSGLIYTSTDGGDHWTSNSVSPLNWSAVACSADGSIMVAAANGGGIYLSRSSPSPILNASSTGDSIALSWLVPSLNFVLQQNSEIGGTNWSQVTNKPTLNLHTLRYETTLRRTNAWSFYRLMN